jgi:hypothetical protein
MVVVNVLKGVRARQGLLSHVAERAPHDLGVRRKRVGVATNYSILVDRFRYVHSGGETE